MRQWLSLYSRLPGMNEMIAAAKGCHGRGTVYTVMKRIHTAAVTRAAGSLKPVKKCSLEILWVEQNKRRDPDNITAGVKFILDGLVASGILPGDGWSHVTGISHRWETGVAPHVSVMIRSEDK